MLYVVQTRLATDNTSWAGSRGMVPLIAVESSVEFFNLNILVVLMKLFNAPQHVCDVDVFSPKIHHTVDAPARECFRAGLFTRQFLQADPAPWRACVLTMSGFPSAAHATEVVRNVTSSP